VEALMLSCVDGGCWTANRETSIEESEPKIDTPPGNF